MNFVILLACFPCIYYVTYLICWLELAFLLYSYASCRGEGALQYFRYRVCAAGQGIIFTILAPKPGIFFCKMLSKGYTISKSLPLDRTTMVILLPDRVFKMRKMLPDKVKITAPRRHTPVHITTKCPQGFLPPPSQNQLMAISVTRFSAREPTKSLDF